MLRRCFSRLGFLSAGSLPSIWNPRERHGSGSSLGFLQMESLPFENERFLNSKWTTGFFGGFGSQVRSEFFYFSDD